MEMVSGAGRLKPDAQRMFYAILGITDVTVNREYDARRDVIDFSIFFRKDGKRYRIDHQEAIRTFDILGGHLIEGFMVGIFTQKIRYYLGS